uniref:tRNA ligase phosphodiesterase domain-containing protein n=1 Tax=Physcomitrium patens TaxID=3218 RepID=A0A7I4CXU8_PHYPA
MVTGLGGRLFVGIPRFVVSSSSKLALLSLPIPLFSGPMTKGKHNIKKLWLPKPKVEAVEKAPGRDVPSGSSQPSASLSSSFSGKKSGDPHQYDSVVGELADLHLEPGLHSPTQEFESVKVESNSDGTAKTVPKNDTNLEKQGKGLEAVNRKNEGHINKGGKGTVVKSKKVNRTVAQAQLLATFYPKFENEKSDQEVRMRMQEVVSAGSGVLEVTMKHSGSLFLYSGDNGGAFAKNSFGNLYTAVGVYVLGRTLKEAWGAQAGQKQREFNAYLKEHRICIGMELVTAVLGDHGQRPLQDYVVVTAVTKLDGRPLFLSTADVVAFCHQWRLPTNHYWLFSTKASVTSFFTAYDALCEEGLTSTVAKVLNDIADIYLSATKRHEDIQGEILEGLVARVVTPESATSLSEVLIKFPPPPSPEVFIREKGLREICASNRDAVSKQVEALLKAVGSDFCSDWTDWLDDKVSGHEDKKNTPLSPMLETFLHSNPADYSTKKLQEMIQVIRKSKLPVRFKCHTIKSSQSTDDQDQVISHFKMIVHVLSDSAFRRYQREMRKHAHLWPLYRGFFVDVCVLTGSNAPEVMNMKSLADDSDQETSGFGESEQSDSVDETENLMLKMKFLPYKIRTFLIRNGISALFDKGVADYKEYYTRQMQIWGTSAEKQMELTKLLNEWAMYIKKKMNGKKLSSNTYLTEAEPFLKQFAERSVKNKKLVGAAGIDIDVDDFLAQKAAQEGDEDEFISDSDHAPVPTAPSPHASAIKAQGMVVFFPGIPGCAKSCLCKEIINSWSGFVMHNLMGDVIKGKYWQKLNNDRTKNPRRITFADKNAPNKEVWQTIQKICKTTTAIGVPVVPESEGTGLNPYSLDILAVFIYRVLLRSNHPGRLDKSTPNPGYVLLMFYNLYDGMDREEFEEELIRRFGHIVKMPVLKHNRTPMPSDVLKIIEEGLDLYRRHTDKYGRLESLNGSFKDEWVQWEKRLNEILFAHKEHLLEIQVPFQEVVENVQKQLTAITSGDFIMHVPVDKEEDRSFRTLRFVAVTLNTDEVLEVLLQASVENPEVKALLSTKNLKESLGKAHVTLAHKASHGGAALASLAPLRGSETQVQLVALLYSNELVALEVSLTTEKNTSLSMNEWPHLTVWTAPGIKAKEANNLPQMVKTGKASRLDLKPVTLSGQINFY